ncbi:MAG: L-2-hydroxyglutarate oxidase, partial [Planctomycetota bacterium]|nr:L-2-hydroxyglutarate oxidase [Planctomycetota bacterium]
TPGSLKARLCVEGREALYRFCAEHEIKHEQCGKIVVATNDDEMNRLKTLRDRGERNGLRDINQLSRTELREREPHVEGVGGLFIRETGIVDFAKVAKAYAKLFHERGGKLRLGSPLRAAHRADDQVIVETNRKTYRCSTLITCAGLQADRVARLCGTKPLVRIIPFRGEYDELVPEAMHLVNNLIYPVPDPRFPFLGVHFTRMIDGAIEAGPSALLSWARHGYEGGSFSSRDVLDMLRFRGFWKMGHKNWRTALDELRRAKHPALRLALMQRLIPELQLNDFRPGRTGVRAMAVDPSGTMLDDFHILRDGPMLHVLSAPSPAATASLAIGKYIASLLAESDK